MPSHSTLELVLVDDESWSTIDVSPSKIDPGLRVVASLLDARDAQQLYSRTGLDITALDMAVPAVAQAEAGKPVPRIPVMVRIDFRHHLATLERLQAARIETHQFALDVPAAYRKEAGRNPRLSVITGRLAWDGSQGAMGLRRALARLLAMEGVLGVVLPNALHPNLDASRQDIKLGDRKIGNRVLTGEGVVVGIIDDGCAFAHRHFLVPGSNASRILALWDQGEDPPAGDPHWSAPAGFGGRELTRAKIEALLQGGLVDEDAVYATARYELDIASHGTHVMDIAAGNGASLMGAEGVANKADIVFVQLPRAAVDSGGPLLEHHILEGILYVFDRAATGNRDRTVVNVSYGGYTGPHDGTSAICEGIDALLVGVPGRAAVVSAGNGFQADCHARRDLQPGEQCELRWLVAAEDPTPNAMEIWYDPPGRLQVLLVPPGAALPMQPALAAPAWKEIRRQDDGKVVGWGQHQAMPNGAFLVRVDLGATEGEDGSPPAGGWALAQQVAAVVPKTAPAPSGCWRVIVDNVGDQACEFHAWIARDDRPRKGRRGQQSRFHRDDADPVSTVADLASGHLTLSVGAHNAATNEICAYSACGPTRDGRAKPELTAPAEETATGRGILCASSRRAQPTPFNGTSAAAPHVAGSVALVMQGRPPVAADRLRKRMMDGSSGQLLSNRIEDADDSGNRKRHAACMGASTGNGKLDVPGSAT